MSKIAESILSVASSKPEGGLLSPKEFLHLGSRAAIDQTFTRLLKEKLILRVSRGIYVLPVHGRFGSRAPSTESVLSAISSQNGEVIVPSGASAANVLGLTTQVPVTEIFITSGRSRVVKLMSRTIKLKHGARWQTALGNRAAGMAIRALAWTGKERANETLANLKTKIPESEWKAILSIRSILPGWLSKISSEVIYE